MLTLTRPDAARYDEWRAAFDEFGATPKDGTGFRASDVVDTSPEGFDAYLADRARQADVSVEPEPGKVHCTYFWVLDDDAVGPTQPGRLVGFVAVRHALTEVLLEAGGHIGYSVRPSARGRGVATAALRLAVAQAADSGIERVLVCCLETNGASRAVIEKCGGQFEDVREHPAIPGASRRYWFGSPPWPTTPDV